MNGLRLIFVTKSDPDSGNYNTAQRICEGLVSVQPTWSYKIVSTDAAVEDLISADVLLCLHLYRCAGLQFASRCHGNRLSPIIGIAGGTDLNEDSKIPERRAAMQKFVQSCRRIVVFSDSLLQSLHQLIPKDDSGTPPVSVIPQGIHIPLTCLEQLQSSAATAEAETETAAYFIIVGRIRPVKNCTSVLEPFRRWKQSQRCSADVRLSEIRLLFVGDIEDSHYGEEFKAQLANTPDSRLLRGVEHLQALRLMTRSLGLINCSISEGQSNSLLEAMFLGVPVIASAVPGNLDLVRHMDTGMVYHDCEQLMQCLTLAASAEPSSRSTIRQITQSAQKFVHEKHNIERELLAYGELIAQCAAGRADT